MIFDDKDVKAGMYMGPKVECTYCDKAVSAGHDVVGTSAHLFHAECWPSAQRWAKVQHAMAHGLCEKLAMAITKIVDESGGQCNKVGDPGVALDTVLLSTEMLGSVWRRLAKDKGITRPDLHALRALAVQCAKDIYTQLVESAPDDDDESGEEAEGGEEQESGEKNTEVKAATAEDTDPSPKNVAATALGNVFSAAFRGQFTETGEA